MNNPEFVNSTEFGVLLAVQLLFALWNEMDRNYSGVMA